MLNKQVFLEMYSLFYDQFVGLPVSQCSHLAFDQYKIFSKAAQGGQWLIFCLMAQDHTREVLNEINSFMSDILSLDAWSRVNDQCPEHSKFDFSIEILAPTALSTINRVYVTKQRLIYVSCMLLHQTKMIIDTNWKDFQLDESKININTIHKFNSVTSNVTDLDSALRDIDGTNFRDKSKDFRNSYQHRIPINIEVGLSAFVSRVDNGNRKITYGFGGQQPLAIRDMLPLLHEQHRLCVTAFQQYWKSLTEQIDIWKRERPIIT
ncbi:MAG: hypothetical protein WCJ37_14815 [Syntrophus sp. (in: bacteria)]